MALQVPKPPRLQLNNGKWGISYLRGGGRQNRKKKSINVTFASKNRRGRRRHPGEIEEEREILIEREIFPGEFGKNCIEWALNRRRSGEFETLEMATMVVGAVGGDGGGNPPWWLTKLQGKIFVWITSLLLLVTNPLQTIKFNFLFY